MQKADPFQGRLFNNLDKLTARNLPRILGVLEFAPHKSGSMSDTEPHMYCSYYRNGMC